MMQSNPTRIRRERTKGWRKPEGSVMVSRPHRWGNPFLLGDFDSPQECVDRFRDWLLSDAPTEHVERHAWMRQHIAELRGKSLGCYCPLDAPCHADVLLQLANRRLTHADYERAARLAG